ncbi:hypothetical protein ACFVH6_12750 [Spirillospora sp. NPDC127200]
MDVPPLPDAAAVRPEPTTATRESLIADIEARFPGWGAWHSDAHRWWAFRTSADPLTIDQLRAGCRLLVQADTHAELCRAISAEIESARRAA